jgi:hypothetical protein
MLLSAHYTEVQGPRADFTCPRCHQGPSPGFSYERTDTTLLLAVIPVLRTRNTYLICGNCRSRLVTRMTLDDLRQCVGVDISRFVFYRVSFILKALSVLSLLLCLFPVLGMILSAITLIGTFKSPGVWRTIAIISLIISIVPTSLVAFGIWR